MEGNEVVGFTRQLYNHLPVCVSSSENLDGEEELFFGSTDGFVYQIDKGTSFNGEAIEAALKLHPNHIKSPRTKKRIRRITLELTAPSLTYLKANVEFDYGETYGPEQTKEIASLDGIWATSFWEDLVWNGGNAVSAPLDIDGTALNFSLSLYHSGEFEDPIEYLALEDGSLVEDEDGNYIELERRTGLTNAGSHTIQGYIVEYSPRGLQR